MARYINPLTDEGFKRIFGQEEHKTLLIAFLNRLFDGELTITDVTYLDKEILPQEHDEGKRYIYDIYCTIDTGEHVIVEMQHAEQRFFLQRNLLYAARAIDRQALKGKRWHYNDLKAVYSISFLNFEMSSLPHRLLVDGRLKDEATNEHINPFIRLIYIQLPLMTKELEECENNFERWIYLLKNVEDMEMIPSHLSKTMQELEYFERVMEEASLTPEERARYERSLKCYRDEVGVIEYHHEKGRAEGREEGRAEGREEGIAVGSEKERERAIRMMAELGIAVDTIAERYGLTVDEVKRILS